MEQTLNCLVVDDDKEVNAYVCDMVRQTAFLHLAGSFYSADEALPTLSNGGIGLLILDINLPGIDGVTFAGMLKNGSAGTTPKVILISGSKEYAVDGYKVDAIDYLVKPFQYQDFYKAAAKALSVSKSVKPAEALTDHLFLKVEHALVRVGIADILYVESFKDYIKVFTTTGMVTALSTLKSIEDKLTPHGFIRIHRSFIINPAKVESIQHMTVKIGKTTIPVTEQYRDAFRKHFEEWL
ncbi:response regulator transcription factor [Mucilaginibacter achroorhodeus]|uniref:Response regulator transcription factor n=1 Tax=Mucilaginibacter achroorhodeus TaxID=2599294 RepID=A0A563U2P7_9SPHI|nr:LytTR family DNA-binding domain-containing protein [Mucilaginibacter achroorhodeus]TWR25613.1 response regulator transcription factor [Mucilaginibacter achroorhodeus]